MNDMEALSEAKKRLDEAVTKVMNGDKSAAINGCDAAIEIRYRLFSISMGSRNTE